MKIAVLVKHTVDVRNVRIDPETGAPSLEGKAGLDRADLHAVSEAVDLLESGEGELTVIGLGPVEMKDDIVSAIAAAMGNAEGKLIAFEDEADSLFAARSLATELTGFDVIITGKLSEDYGTGQLGMQVAELLDIPHLSGVINARQADGSLAISYELDGFPDEIEVPTPLVLVLNAREGEPKRHPNLRGMMSAKKKNIEQLSTDSSPANHLSWTSPMAARRGGDRVVIKGEDPAVAAKKLADWLKEHRLVG